MPDGILGTPWFVHNELHVRNVHNWSIYRGKPASWCNRCDCYNDYLACSWWTGLVRLRGPSEHHDCVGLKMNLYDFDSKYCKPFP